MTKFVVTVIPIESARSNMTFDLIRGIMIKERSIDKQVVVKIKPSLEDPVKLETITRIIKDIRFRNTDHLTATVRKIIKGNYTPKIRPSPLDKCGTRPLTDMVEEYFS